jgi:hypothetical protein
MPECGEYDELVLFFVQAVEVLACRYWTEEPEDEAQLQLQVQPEMMVV